MHYLNYSSAGNTRDLPVSDYIRQGITSLLRDAHSAIKQDLADEKAKHITALKEAKNFLAFYNQNEEDFIALSHFMRDHGGAYDKKKALYDWQNLYPVAYCIFAFHCDMPGRARLIELTAHYDWAVFALDDSEICRFVTANFCVYAHLPDKFADSNGEPQTILERMNFRLSELCKQRPFEPGSYQWSLMSLLQQYLYANLSGV